MITIEAVAETYDAVGFTAWPVADPPDDRLQPVSGALSSAEVGLVMAVLAEYNHLADDEEEPDGPEILRRMIADERIIGPGGLRIRDTSKGIDVIPGCCAGLESWHEWLDVPGGGAPWLGHGPSPRIQHVAELVRVWPDEGTSLPPVEVPAAELSTLLDDTHQRLRDFLGLVEPWAAELLPSRSGELVAVLSRDLHITG